MELTADLISRHSLPQIHERGEALHEAGAVKELRRYPRHLAGAVQTRQRYRQTFFKQENGKILAQCSCAYSGSRWCKHLVASALAYLGGNPPVVTAPYPTDQDLSGAWDNVELAQKRIKKKPDSWVSTMEDHLEAGGPAAAFKILIAAYELRNKVELVPSFSEARDRWVAATPLAKIAPQAGRILLEIFFQRLDRNESKNGVPILPQDFLSILFPLSDLPGLAQYLRIRFDGYGLVQKETAPLYLHLLGLLRDHGYAETIRKRYGV